MADEKSFHGILRTVFDSLTDEQKKTVTSCKDGEELIAMLGKIGVALPDELLDAVAGGALVDFVSVALQPMLTNTDEASETQSKMTSFHFL